MIPPIAQFLTAINRVLEKEKRAQVEKEELAEKHLKRIMSSD
ncbi:MAG: hypothetical protein AB8G86_26450 [Saprospiraceae bacterium]